MERNANLPLVLTNLVYFIVIKNFQEKYRHLFTSFFSFCLNIRSHQNGFLKAIMCFIFITNQVFSVLDGILS